MRKLIMNTNAYAYVYSNLKNNYRQKMDLRTAANAETFKAYRIRISFFIKLNIYFQKFFLHPDYCLNAKYIIDAANSKNLPIIRIKERKDNVHEAENISRQKN